MATWIVVGIALLGFIPLLIVLWKRQRVKKLVENGEHVTGVVEDIQEHMGYKRTRSFRVLIRYNAGGLSIPGVYKYTSYNRLPLFETGKPVAVIYNRDKPEKFIPRDVPQNKGLLIFTIIIAVVYIVLCFFLYDFMKKEGL